MADWAQFLGTANKPNDSVSDNTRIHDPERWLELSSVSSSSSASSGTQTPTKATKTLVIPTTGTITAVGSDELVHTCPFRLDPEDSRYTIFPIHRQELYDWYERALACFWITKDIDMSQDAHDYEFRLNAAEKHFVKHVLAFFAASDRIVNVNLAERFLKDVPMLEAQMFYDWQKSMENIHAVTYSTMLNAVIKDTAERMRLFNSIETMPIIRRLSDYMFDAIASDAPFGERLLRFACVEGIFFTGCFCAIYWLSNSGRMPGLSQSNKLIARDEGLHTEFAALLYTMMESGHMLDHARAAMIITGAVDLASEFIHEAIPNPMPMMNAQLMIEYTRCQADNLMALIKLPPIYGATSQFHFMERVNMELRSNFFERRPTEYARAQTADDANDFTPGTDF